MNPHQQPNYGQHAIQQQQQWQRDQMARRYWWEQQQKKKQMGPPPKPSGCARVMSCLSTLIFWAICIGIVLFVISMVSRR